MSRGNREPSLRRRIERLLGDLPYADSAMTATDIAGQLKARLSSVSSCLRKMVRSKKLVRVEGFGPRGGYGYRRKSMMESISDDMTERIMREIDRQVMDDLFMTTKGLRGIV